jgi:iron complex transport system substrate-binding protein
MAFFVIFAVMKRAILFFLTIALLAACGPRGAKNNTADTAHPGDESPAQRIVCMSSSHVAFLNELGADDRIVGVSGAGFISDTLVRRRIAAGDVVDVGWGGNYDLEAIVALKPDLVLTNGSIDSDDAGAQDKELARRLTGMGIRCFAVGEWLEQTPLGRAGWIVPIAELCGLEERGRERLAEITRNYEELKARVSALTRGTNLPMVMFNAPYRDVWYIPGDANYMVRLVRDAGGEYVCRELADKGGDSRPIDIEEAFVAMRGADFWLGVGQYNTLAGLLADNPRFASAPPVRDGRVFNNNARTTPGGGSDFWESGVVRPDIVLRDLVTILHPEEAEAFGDTAPLYYYKRME